MKILVRLPNWLGDMVMSVGFVNQLPQFFPGAEVSVVAKKGIHELLGNFPQTHHRFVFSKEEYPGLKGLWKFGKEISRKEKFDLFFCLPDSFSSAFMGLATGAVRRIGYKKELREVLLTNSYARPTNRHRVEEYIQLLELFTVRPAAAIDVSLQHSYQKREQVVVNINSEASSRRLTVPKAVEILTHLRNAIDQKIILIGAPREREFVEGVIELLPDKAGVESVAGQTSLTDLMEILGSSRLMLTTDSGPAHLANALGTQTIVLFGAGDENNTAPYNRQNREVIRLGKLSCEPCRKNVCLRFETPQCLELLEPGAIVHSVMSYLHSK